MPHLPWEIDRDPLASPRAVEAPPVEAQAASTLDEGTADLVRDVADGGPTAVAVLSLVILLVVLLKGKGKHKGGDC